MEHPYKVIQASSTFKTPENILTNQLVKSLPEALEKSLNALTLALEMGSMDQQIQAANIILRTATILAKLKS